MPDGAAEARSSGSEDSSAGAGPADELAMARANRDVTVGLSGTCIAVLTFAMFFLFDRARAGSADMTLFQVTLADLVGAEAFLAYAGTCYAWQVAAIRRHQRTDSLERWADPLLAIGMLAMSLSPALILFCVNLVEVGAFAFATWLVIPIALLFRRRRGESQGPDNAR